MTSSVDVVQGEVGLCWLSLTSRMELLEASAAEICAAGGREWTLSSH